PTRSALRPVSYGYSHRLHCESSPYQGTRAERGLGRGLAGPARSGFWSLSPGEIRASDGLPHGAFPRVLAWLGRKTRGGSREQSHPRAIEPDSCPHEGGYPYDRDTSVG